MWLGLGLVSSKWVSDGSIDAILLKFTWLVHDVGLLLLVSSCQYFCENQIILYLYFSSSDQLFSSLWFGCLSVSVTCDKELYKTTPACDLLRLSLTAELFYQPLAVNHYEQNLLEAWRVFAFGLDLTWDLTMFLGLTCDCDWLECLKTDLLASLSNIYAHIVLPQYYFYDEIVYYIELFWYIILFIFFRFKRTWLLQQMSWLLAKTVMTPMLFRHHLHLQRPEIAATSAVPSGPTSRKMQTF